MKRFSSFIGFLGREDDRRPFRRCALAAAALCLGLTFESGVVFAQEVGEEYRRGYGFTASAFANGAFPRIRNVTNGSTGGLSGQTVTTEDSTDFLVFAPSLAVGYNLHRWGIPIRAEIEYAARGKVEYDAQPVLSGATGVDVQSTVKNDTVMANLYLDFSRPGKKWQPYIGLGLGVSFNDTNADVTDNGSLIRVSKKLTEFAYSGMAGVAYPLGQNWWFDTRLRYVNLGSLQFGPQQVTGGGLQLDAETLDSIELGIGLRWHF
ncbi:MAG: outer membrane beta-barrel protein [Pseudomonadota bacterium]